MENVSNYGFYLMVEQLLEKFQNRNFKCFGENVERYIVFFFSAWYLQKRTKNSRKIIKHDLKFFDSCRFMQVPLSGLTENLHSVTT